MRGSWRPKVHRIHLSNGEGINDTSARALCGLGVSLLDLTLSIDCVTCDECMELSIPLSEYELGDKMQANPIPPQRLWGYDRE